MVRPGPAETLILWVGTVGLALASLAFAAVWRGETDRRPRRFVRLATLVPAVAAVAYATTATGVGIATVRPGGSPVPLYWARYADWLVTLPLLVFLLTTLAAADRSTVRTLVAIAVAMVGTWLAGAVAPRTRPSIGFWALGSVLLLVLASVLVRRLDPPSTDQSAGRHADDVAETVATLRTLLIALVTAYPVVWIFGPASTLAIVDPTTAAYMVLDLLAKAGFPYLLIRNRHVLDGGVGGPADHGESPDDDGRRPEDGYSPR